MGYSRNELGEIGEDGQLRDANGNVVPVGLDDKAKEGLQELLDGPKVRTAPSEKDNFFANGGTLEARPLEANDVVPNTGYKDDLQKADAPKASKKSESK